MYVGTMDYGLWTMVAATLCGKGKRKNCVSGVDRYTKYAYACFTFLGQGALRATGHPPIASRTPLASDWTASGRHALAVVGVHLCLRTLYFRASSRLVYTSSLTATHALGTT